ncbi:hypothetical protein RR46_01690 [Papilio xuthus]|uniref:Uncharacterized protein n=1 Tax=Papilio xuthus TaxID=66420 RepID=A0A0N0PAD0_PAPXU|nr:hypothetical protein RR46_01690 [Papilio xuthus]
MHSLQTCTQLALWLAGTWHGANTRLHLFPAHTGMRVNGEEVSHRASRVIVSHAVGDAIPSDNINTIELPALEWVVPVPAAEADDRLVDGKYNQGVALQYDSDLTSLCTSSPRWRWGPGGSRPGHALERAVGSAGQRWAAASGTSASRAAAAVWGARARVLAQTAGQPALSHGRRGRHDGDYLTVRSAVVTPRALGLHTTHLSRYLIAMLRGLDLASRANEALGNYVVQVKMNDLLEMQIAGAESDLLSAARDEIETDGTSTDVAYDIDAHT